MAIAYPDQPMVSCHALVVHDGAVLFVKRGGPPYEGYWSLPGGGMSLGETVEEALQRELQEETGLLIAPVRLLGYLDGINRDEDGRIRYHYVMIYFEAQWTGGTLVAGDDARDAAWLTPAEARQRLLTDSALKCLEWAGL